jgi:FkbM family methyltransferase
MKIFYGTSKQKLDVTDRCAELTYDGILTIPAGDANRAALLSDPVPGVLKYIYVHDGKNVSKYDATNEITINTRTGQHLFHVIDQRLNSLQQRLSLKYGTFQEEVPEQKMSVRFLQGHEKVLEIGGNIGRNTMIIASLLQHNALVTLETDSEIARQLQENRDSNAFTFPIENSALSTRRMIQKGWDSKHSDVLEPGYFWVNTITYNELVIKYGIDFDTLVADCEGALYYILLDMPEILTNINLILMENDYHELSHKEALDAILTRCGFERMYVEGGGWGPCTANFFEAWRKSIYKKIV